MSNKTWEFLRAEKVYLYPSSNADDGGDVNSEKNLSEISHKFTSRNFVIRRKNDEVPLCVGFKGNNIRITDGEAVIEGYYAAIKTGSSGYIEFPLDSAHIPSSEFNKFINSYKNLFAQLYETRGSGVNLSALEDEQGNWIPKSNVSKKFRKENPLPCLHVVIKLLKNTTGNLRGDLTERNYEDPNLTYRVCKGLAISICTDEELEELGSLYVDLAWIYVDPSSTSSHITIHHVVNDNSRYTYIDEDFIITEDGMTIREWVQEYVKEKLDSLDHLTHKTEITETKESWKDSILYVRDDDSGVIRYILKEPLQYDDNGDPLITIDEHYDRTYSFDEIQKRTHPVSSTSTSEKLNNEIARQVDSRDTGAGEIETYQSDSDTIHKKTKNINGNSPLLARGDHTHDGRYIYTELATKSTQESRGTTQEIGTHLKIKGNTIIDGNIYVKASSGETEEDKTSVFEGHVDIRQGARVQQNLEVLGDMTADGTIRGRKVYNAVWNDYADFLPKSPGETYEPGDLICKKRGCNEYIPSNLEDASLVVGVVSDTYGVLLGGDSNKNEEENKENYIPVAVAGNVYAKVIGHVHEGDFIVVSSIPGVGMAISRGNNTFINLTVGCVVGKALQDKTTEDIERILIQVMLR